VPTRHAEAVNIAPVVATVTPDPAVPFDWRDGERLIRFGRGAIGDAHELLGADYVLLTTERAAATAPTVVAAARAVHHVGPGRVDEIAAALRAPLRAERVARRLVALGGGRVIDTAKALAAADPPRHVGAIPTTLSGAEMTSIHRQIQGVPPGTPGVRPATVINDPALCASQPEAELAASALNALGHCVEAPLTPLCNPVGTLAAHAGARLIAEGFGREGEPDRDALALAALLAGYAISAGGYGLHHVVAQTLVRLAGIGHGQANAALLPHTLGALQRRFPERLSQFAAALSEDPSSFAARLAQRAGSTRLRDLGMAREQLGQCADAASQRGELAMTAPAADRAELLALYEAAW